MDKFFGFDFRVSILHGSFFYFDLTYFVLVAGVLLLLFLFIQFIEYEIFISLGFSLKTKLDILLGVFKCSLKLSFKLKIV